MLKASRVGHIGPELAFELISQFEIPHAPSIALVEPHGRLPGSIYSPLSSPNEGPMLHLSPYIVSVNGPMLHLSPLSSPNEGPMLHLSPLPSQTKAPKLHLSPLSSLFEGPMLHLSPLASPAGGPGPKLLCFALQRHRRSRDDPHPKHVSIRLYRTCALHTWKSPGSSYAQNGFVV